MEEILRVIVPIIFVIIWVLSQVLGKRNKPVKPRQGAPQRPVGPPKNISDEIESFLKQVADKRGAEPPAQIELLEPDEFIPQQPAPRRAPVELPPLVIEPAAADLAAEELRPVLSSRGEVSAHVEGHIGASSFAERTSRLGEDVDQIDDDVDERIHQEFDHHIGNIAHVESAKADAAFDRHDMTVWEESQTDTSVAASLADVFKDPQSIRRAIILNEILRPPTGRW